MTSLDGFVNLYRGELVEIAIAFGLMGLVAGFMLVFLELLHKILKDI